MSYKQGMIEQMKAHDADAQLLLEYLVLSLRDDKTLSTLLKSEGLSKNACRNVITGEGTVSLTTAMKVAEACGYRLTLEVIE